jgi:hypothetical protein
MEFILYYRGPLKANGSPGDKHKLREHFHYQLLELWKRKPLLEIKDEALDPNPNAPSYNCPSFVKKVGGKLFVPLVNQTLAWIAELDIMLLRPEDPGNIITKGGDIDNRIKTLLDALKIPDENQVNSTKDLYTIIEPLHCLLEDDALVTQLAVSTHRLLENTSNNSEVILIINVNTKKTIGTFLNLGID